MSDIKELNDEELDKVTGGTYSGSTYAELGLNGIPDNQDLSNHPLITTIGNRCSLSDVSCINCPNYERYISAFSGYCRARSEERDDAK